MSNTNHLNMVKAVFTPEQLDKATKLKKAKPICSEIVEPHMQEINKITGQENVAMFWAYALEHYVNIINKEQ